MADLEKNTTGEKPKFPKSSLMNSERFAERKDVLNIVVEENEYVTISEAESRIEKFMKKKVK